MRKKICLLLWIFLTACGGGGGGGNNDASGNNVSPAFTSASSISVKENETILAYAAEAEDPDGTIVSMAISGGQDQSQFVLDAQDRTLSFKSPKDFESPEDSDANNKYVVEITATDDAGATTTLALTVTVTNVDQPEAEILFPTPNANVGVGTDTAIAVKVRLTDTEDDIVDMNFVTVNGNDLNVEQSKPSSGAGAQAAASSKVRDGKAKPQDGSNLITHSAKPSSWTGTVSLTPGSNELTIMAESEDGTDVTSTETATNTLPVLPLGPATGLVIDPTGESIYLSEPELDAIQSVNMTSMEPQVVAKLDFMPGDFVFAADGVRLFTIDPMYISIHELDITTGATRVVYSPSAGAGTALINPRRIDIDEVNNRLVVLDISGTGLDEIDRLVAVDISTGDLAVISDETTGSGPQVLYPQNLAVDRNGLAYVVGYELGSAARSLLSVDLSDGTRTIVASEFVGAGPMPQVPSAVALDVPAAIAYVADAFGAVTTVDLNRGDKTLLADSIKDYINTGGEKDLALDSANQRLLVTDNERQKIWSIDTQTGERSLFYDTPTGTGPAIESAYSLYFDQAQNQLLVLNQNDALIAVDLSTGNRSIIAGSGAGTGPTSFGTGIAPDIDNNRVFVPGFASILEIDLVTGNRTEVSGPVVGSGPAFEAIRYPVIDRENDRILIIDGMKKAIMAVDLASGNRSILSDANTGTGVALDSPLDMVIDEAQNRLLVTQNIGPMLAIDLDTGDRAAFSGDGVGLGPEFWSTSGIALDAANSRALVFGTIGFSTVQFFAIDLATGDRTEIRSETSKGVTIDGAGGLSLDSDGGRLFFTSSLFGAVLAIELGSGDTVIVSK
jgi:hypothetical protein